MEIKNLPNFLTLIRLIVSPLILPILLVKFLPYNNFVVNCILATIFFLLAITDFFDGLIARKYNAESELGKSIDHVADKFLLVATLISLLTVNKINFFWVIVLISRELFIMALRILALENKFSVPVSFWGKLKTSSQYLMLLFVIINPCQSLGWKNSWNLTQSFLVLLSVFTSLYSAFKYYSKFKLEFEKRE